MHKAILIVIILFLSAWPLALAEEGGSEAVGLREGHLIQGEGAREPIWRGPLTISRAAAIALEHNRQIQIALQVKVKAKGLLIEATSGALPQLAFAGNYTRSDMSFLGTKDNYSLALNLTQPIYLGGSVRAAIRGAKVHTNIADEILRQRCQEVLFEAKRGYYDVLLAKELESADEEQVNLTRSHLEEVEKRLKEGVASKFDLLRAQVALANARAQAIQSKNAVRLAVTSFLKTLGLSPQSQVDFVDELRDEEVAPEFDQEESKALIYRSDLRQAALNIRYQKEKIEIAKSGLRPRLNFLATYQWARPFAGLGDAWEDELSGMLTLEVPLFDGFRTKGKVMQEEASLAAIKTLALDLEETMRTEIEQALLSIEDAQEFVQSQEANVAQAEESLRLAEVGYRNGVNRLIEVLDARVALTQARRNLSQAIYNHMLARLLLERATGLIGEELIAARHWALNGELVE